MRDPEFLDRMLALHGEQVVVSVDARGGMVSLAGWTESSDVAVADAVAELGGRGVARFLFTPIEVDGTLEGPGMEALAEVAAAAGSASVIYSGGVGTLEDLETLRARRRAPTSRARSSAGRCTSAASRSPRRSRRWTDRRILRWP